MVIQIDRFLMITSTHYVIMSPAYSILGFLAIAHNTNISDHDNTIVAMFGPFLWAQDRKVTGVMGPPQLRGPWPTCVVYRQIQHPEICNRNHFPV